MNGFRTLTATLAIFLTSAAPAFAAGTRADHSGLVVWTFLGFCGLILVAQLIPALLLVLGLARGTVAYRPSPEANSNN